VSYILGNFPPRLKVVKHYPEGIIGNLDFMANAI
jgi:hypothetical protein